MDPNLAPVMQLLMSNPQMLGSILASAESDPAGVAALADRFNMPLPNSPEFQSMLQPFGGLGHELSQGPVMGTPMTRSIVPMAAPMDEMTGSVHAPTGIGGGPPATMPDVPATAGAMADPRSMIGTADVLGAMAPGGEVPGMGMPGPGANPLAGTVAALQQTGQGRPPRLVPPTPQKPQMSGGISGAQKAPDPSAPIKPSQSPAQALIAAMMGGQNTKLPVPTLGALLNG